MQRIVLSLHLHRRDHSMMKILKQNFDSTYVWDCEYVFLQELRHEVLAILRFFLATNNRWHSFSGKISIRSSSILP